MNYKNKTKIFLVKLIEFIIYVLWDLSGLRFIYRKLRPLSYEEENISTYKKPSTFFIWVVGIYLALFGLASQKYENALNKIETKINILSTQLTTKHFKEAIANIPKLQKLKCPYKPSVKKPITVLKSVFYEDVICTSTVNELKGIIEVWKKNLNSTSLDYVNLNNANLRSSNLKMSKLSNSELNEVILSHSDMHSSNLEGSSLVNSILTSVNFKHANLYKSDLSNSNGSAEYHFNTDRRFHYSAANFTGADLGRAKIVNAKFAESDFTNANLTNAKLYSTIYKNAYLANTNFTNANLIGGNFTDAFLTNTNFTNANLTYANFTKSKKLTYKQLVNAKSLYKVKGLEKELKKKLRELKPELFKKNYRKEYVP